LLLTPPLHNTFDLRSASCYFQAFAKVGMDYAQLSNEPALLEKCQEIATNATWGIKLGRLKVNALIIQLHFVEYK